jgi:hypothetical protein
MDAHTLESICNQVYRRYPAVSGARPSVQAQGDNTLLIFRAKAKTEDGKALSIIVRAVIDPAGKILKMSSSR